MREIIMLPGYGGSGPAHWQSLWQAADPAIRRFAPASWDEPDLEDWIAALDRSVAACARPPVLVAHSLACLLVTHWAARGGKAAGAMLVAVPDPQGPQFPQDAADFGAEPMDAFSFPSLMVASSDDPYADLAFARSHAAAWGSDYVDAGALGHINGESGIGDWPQGRGLLAAFVAGLSG